MQIKLNLPSQSLKSERIAAELWSPVDTGVIYLSRPLRKSVATVMIIILSFHQRKEKARIADYEIPSPIWGFKNRPMNIYIRSYQLEHQDIIRDYMCSQALTFLIICSSKSSMVIVDLLSLMNWPRTAWGWQQDWRRRRRGLSRTCGIRSRLKRNPTSFSKLSKQQIYKFDVRTTKRYIM